MAETFNYIDFLNSSANIQYMADQHDRAVEMKGRKAYIFMLDRKETERSEVYREETHGRIYLPHFEQRAIYKTATFLSSLGVENYTEKEDNLELEFDFGRMVHNIHELKSNNSGKLCIENTSRAPLNIEIFEGVFYLKNRSEILFSKKVEGSIYKFVGETNTSTNLIKLSYEGNGDTIEFLERFSTQILPRRKYELALNNSVYRNVNDVISKGDLILNDKMKLYQVVGAYPKDDAYTAYISWKVQVELINMAKADGLPGDFAELIKNNRYNLGKINI